MVVGFKKEGVFLVEVQNKGQLELTQEQLRVYEKNEKLVYYFLNKMKIPRGQFEELEQVGKIGLVKAIKTFDESKKNKFSSYAVRCITNEIYMFFRSNKKYQKEISFETVVASDGEHELTLLDTLKNEETSSFEETIFDREQLIEVISILLNEIVFPKNYTMFLIVAGKTQKEIGKQFGVERSTIAIRQIRLREELKDKLKEGRKKFVFQVSIQQEKMQVSFEPRKIANAKQVLLQLLLKAKENSIGIHFEIYYSSKRILLQFPLEQESFLLLALFIKEIEENKTS